MRKLILISFLPLLIFAQSENQSQSIELPDFVITGKQRVDLPVMKKAKADPVSILSKEYFFPSFTPEQFTLATVAKPAQLIADVLPQEESYYRQLIIGAGQYTLPTGRFYFTQPFATGKFYSELRGTNRKDYVDYADYNVSGINVGTDFYIDRNGEFLPGAILNVDAKFVRKEYNFYSDFRPSNVDPVKRETQNSFAKFSIENGYGDYVKYKFGFGGNYLDIKDADAKETNLKFSGNTRIKFGSFSILVDGNYRNQNIARSTGDDNYSFFKLSGGVQLNLSNKLILRTGVGYYNADDRQFLNQLQPFEKVTNDLAAPWGEIDYSLSNSLSFRASYKPEIEFKTYSDYLDVNRYVHVSEPNTPTPSLDNSSSVFNHKLNAAFTYGYKKYYEVVAGGEIFTADKYAFFNSDFSFDNTPGHSYSFKIDRMDNVTGYSLYTNALFHFGPFGWFYGDVKYQVVKSEENNDATIPYEPKLTLEAAYGYKFDFGFSAELKLHYLKDTYADRYNYILLDDYINLSAKLRYSLTQNFDFTLHLNNLLNRDNYLWLGYIEPPFDITAGIDFRF